MCSAGRWWAAAPTPSPGRPWDFLPTVARSKTPWATSTAWSSPWFNWCRWAGGCGSAGGKAFPKCSICLSRGSCRFRTISSGEAPGPAPSSTWSSPVRERRCLSTTATPSIPTCTPSPTTTGWRSCGSSSTISSSCARSTACTPSTWPFPPISTTTTPAASLTCSSSTAPAAGPWTRWPRCWPTRPPGAPLPVPFTSRFVSTEPSATGSGSSGRSTPSTSTSPPVRPSTTRS